jgi:hypothetical protein
MTTPFGPIPCPSDECPMCTGEACALCGAGCWNGSPSNRGLPPCEHDVLERHEDGLPAKSIATLGARAEVGYDPIAALYVVTDGVYFGIDGVDPWDVKRDARAYAGPHPVVAHPPCERWGRYWGGGPMLAGTKRQKKKGDDGGCFAAAIAAVRKYGGVLEHPEASHAWLAAGLLAPRRGFGWEPAGDWLGFTCCVEQGHYGHRARKATWLYAVAPRASLPEMPWGSSGAKARIDDGFHSKEERRASGRPKPKEGALERLSKEERTATPIAFRDLLIAIARSAHGYVHESKSIATLRVRAADDTEVPEGARASR